MKKLIIGIIVSILAVGILISKIDTNEITNLQNVSWFYFIPFILFGISGQIVFSLRWYLLLGKKTTYSHSLLSYLMGAGGNMVLPARGGDLFRIYYIKKESAISYPFVLSRLFLEKVLDFLVIVMLGLAAFFLMGLDHYDNGSLTIFSVSLVVIAGMVFFLSIIRFRTVWLIGILKQISERLGKGVEFHYKVESHLIDMAEFLSWKSFLYPFLITLFLWLVLYAGTYFAVQNLLGIELSYAEIVFLMFCGAMGVAVPSAPSGIGVFHASIVGGFILLKKGTTEGLKFATVLHLSQFLLFSVIALLFYLMWTLKISRKNS